MTAPTLPGGFLIVIEGIDGAGKTTLARGLQGLLAQHGAPVSLSKEPTTGPWGMKLRESAAAGRLTPEVEADYLVRDRRDHVHELIAPALGRGEVVILDRYFPSMVAYQGAAGLPVSKLLHANDFAPRPDIVLLLDLSPEEGLARIRARGDAPNHFETPDNLERCREIFLILHLDNKHVLDASKPADQVLREATLQVLLSLTDKARRAMRDPVDAVRFVEPYLPSLSATP